MMPIWEVIEYPDMYAIEWRTPQYGYRQYVTKWEIENATFPVICEILTRMQLHYDNTV